MQQLDIVESGYSVNEKIKSAKVLLIDNEGNQLGIHSTKEALTIAKSQGLDLVEVSPNANPPVCKLANYGKIMYDLKKKLKGNMSGKSDDKEIRLGVNIADHDLRIKAKQTKEFLKSGSKVKLQVKFIGREITHSEIGNDIISKFLEYIEIGKLQSNPVRDGKTINTTIVHI